jgi:cellulose synthase/poly-beta-1,6-N-acetylglucosamine synthase-like glycosyltransferase
MDDTDIAFRLKDMGAKLLYCPEAIGIHMRPLDTVEKVVDSGKRYGQTLAECYCRIPNFRREIASFGARFNGGWHQLINHPWNYVKDTGRRWAINQYTISLILGLASRIPITNPPSRVLVSLSKEIWAYYFRQEFKMNQPDYRF